MACGGIYPIRNLHPEIRDIFERPYPCWMCGKLGAKHFCDEWDTPIHARCVAKFLLTEEGECVIEHGHTVEIDFSLETPHDESMHQMPPAASV